MNLVELTQHPERLDRDTLYELRSLLALYPYYQTVRLLMLQNLYLLHDPTFDEELRRAAIHITDRRVLFQMIEAVHYRHPNHQRSLNTSSNQSTQETPPSRTLSLINTFLDSIPRDDDETAAEKKPERKPTPADAAIDYVAYLLEAEGGDIDNDDVPQMRGQNLIDTFINVDKGRFTLSEEPQSPPIAEEEVETDETNPNEGIFTETLARIYIKQGKYSQALEIIQRLSLVYPKKNAYFADQIRFLKKLIINNNTK